MDMEDWTKSRGQPNATEIIWIGEMDAGIKPNQPKQLELATTFILPG